MPRRALWTGREAWVLLELTVGGEVHRYTDAPQPQAVTDSAGRTYTYSPGLEPIALEQASGGRGKVSCTITQRPETPWAMLVAQGVSLYRSRAVIRRWYEGTILEDAEVYLRGTVRTSPAYGSADDPLKFTIERRYQEEGTFPRRSSVVDATTWPVTATDYDPACEGAVYPVPVGRPTASPAYLVDRDVAVLGTSYLLIAEGKVTATSVTILDEGDPERSWVCPVTFGADLLGVTVSRAQFGPALGATYPQPQYDRAYHAKFDQGGGGVSGALLSGEQGELRGAGDYMAWLLRTWAPGIPVDWGMFNTYAERINAFKLDFPIVQVENVWGVCEEIMSMVGADWTESAVGGYPLLTRYEAAPEDAIAHIDCSPGNEVLRTSDVQEVGGAVANEFTVQYCPDNSQGRLSKTIIIAPTRVISGGSTDTRIMPSMRCRISQGLFGRLPDEPVKLPRVCDPATAALVGRRRVLRMALPRRAFVVEGPTSRLEGLRLQDVVTVADSSVYIADAVAIVRRRVAMGATIALTLLLLDHPAMQTRRTTA